MSGIMDFLRRSYGAQPVERASILPLARDAQGGLMFALPEFIESARRIGYSAGGQGPSPMDAAGNVSPQAIEDAFNVAGAVTLGSGAFPAEGLGMGIRAYHGSPHDFDKFELSPRTIGTGEGAQAYGHGLYFAENEDVARIYREALASQNSDTVAKTLSDRGGLTPEAIEVLSRAFADRTVRSGGFDRAFSFIDEPGPHPTVEKYRETLREQAPQMREAWDRLLKEKPGKMYEVEINANPEDFLDWDKPLSEQPEVVQQIAREADLSNVPSRLKRRIQAWRGEWEPPEGANIGGEPTGNDLHSALTDFGHDAGSNAALTERLKEAGIPGIRFLDQGSRGAGEGTRNLVMFDDSLIDIIRKYGWAGLLAPGVVWDEQQQ